MTDSASGSSDLSSDTFQSDSIRFASNGKNKLSCRNNNSILKNIQIEPALFLFVIGDSIVSMIVQNFYMDRICRITKGFNDSICDNLTFYQEHEDEVQKLASEYTLYQTLIQGGFPIILALFLGPLTDKYGYIPLMLYAQFGYMLSSILYIVMYSFPLLPPQFLLIASTPIGLCGGAVTHFIAVYGFMATQTEAAGRSYRMGILTAIWDIGTVIGFIVGTSIFKRGGFLPTFLYIFAFYSLSFLYTKTCVQEEKPEQCNLVSLDPLPSSVCGDVCTNNAMGDTLRTFVKERPFKKRIMIFIITAIMSLSYVAWASKTNQYLYTRVKMGWDTEKFAEYSAINTLLGGLGSTFLTLVCLKILHFQDTTVLMLNAVSNTVAYCTYAFANQSLMFAGSAVQMFGNVTTSVCKSILSKCVPKDEYGKILSFVTCCEMIMPFISGPMYTIIYVETLTIFPGAMFLVAAGVSVVIFILSGVLHTLQRRNPTNYSLVIEDD